MKTREKMLLGGTVAVLAIFVVIRFGVLDLSGFSLEGLAATEEDLVLAREDYRETRDHLNREDAIVAEYQRKVRERLQEEESRKDPRAALTEDVVDMCKEIGVELNRIEPAEVEEIEGVDDYEFITINVQYNKAWPQVVELLKAFDANWFLIKELKIISPIDRRNMNVDIRLARVVRISEEEKARRAEEEKKTKRRRGRAR